MDISTYQAQKNDENTKTYSLPKEKPRTRTIRVKGQCLDLALTKDIKLQWTRITIPSSLCKWCLLHVDKPRQRWFQHCRIESFLRWTLFLWISEKIAPLHLHIPWQNKVCPQFGMSILMTAKERKHVLTKCIKWFILCLIYRPVTHRIDIW